MDLATAVDVVNRFRLRLVESERLPRDSRVVTYPPQISVVPDGNPTRALLPHHDGGRTSFLTPSRLDDLSWSPRLRKVDPDSPAAHIVYQAFQVECVGASDTASTDYYPYLQLVAAAYRHQVGSTPAPEQLAQWFGDNIKRTLRLCGEQNVTHLSILSALGHPDPIHALTPVHEATDIGFHGACGCGCCPTQSERFWCSGLVDVTGLSWHDVRTSIGTFLKPAAGDLVFGHNLAALHGATDGGRGRRLIPICVVVEDVASPEYEQWLFQLWRRHTTI